ncbi:unnamed protein product [Schistosoma margrebowiei]|uniref:Uncharacterized protein n=1 Tax=Schistosoma margrebowiei TaxID=48269 RepID=A0A183MH76_9TREM|nr:unnamed protein product [Schistosoma margrebowiei]
MMIKNTSVVILLFTILLLKTDKAMQDKSSKTTSVNQRGSVNKTIFNFTDPKNEVVFKDWIEYSDTEQRSKATLLRLDGQTSGDRQRIELPLSRSLKRFHGRQTSIPLPSNLNQISRFGIQAYTSTNGIKEKFGVGSIEIFTISIYKKAQQSV